MNTFQLHCFLKVSQTLNFAKAAEQLNITQPAVTHQIRSLENELNIKLFKRTTRNVELTYAGITFINDAKSIIDIEMRARKRFESLSENEIKLFSIGCQSNSIMFNLTNPIKDLVELYPNVHPKIKTLQFFHLFRLLEDEDVDIIVSFKTDYVNKSTIYYKELIKIPLYCLCHRNNPLSQRNSITFSDLKDEKVIFNDPAKTPSELSQTYKQIATKKKFLDFYTCESSEEINMLVGSGIGVSILPELLIPDNPDIVKIPIEETEPISFGIYYKTPQNNSILKDFIKIMIKNFKD